MAVEHRIWRERRKGKCLSIIADKVIPDDEQRSLVKANFEARPVPQHHIGVDEPYSRTSNMDTPFLDVIARTLGDDARGNYQFQKFRTSYSPMMVPTIMRNILPIGIVGLFALLMIMLHISTDDSRVFNARPLLSRISLCPFARSP